MIILFTVTDKCSNPENFVPVCAAEIEYEFDNCKSFKKRIEKFEQDLRIFEKKSDNSFFNAIFYLIYYTLLDNKNEFEHDFIGNIYDHNEIKVQNRSRQLKTTLLHF